MQYLKKQIIFVSIFCVLWSNSAFAIPMDAKDKSYEKAVGVLSALEIMKSSQDGSFNPEDIVKRPEMAQVMLKMLGMQEGDFSSVSEEMIFTDVQPGNPFAGCIRMASGLGIMSGYDDGRFGIEDPVTYEQAVKIIVSALGYDLYARSKGGFPTGYLAVAAEKGITKNVDGTVGSSVNRGILAGLLFNALEVDLMEQNGFGEEAAYSINRGKNLLTEKLHVTKSEGQVRATDETCLNTGTSSLSKDEVQIEDNIYKIGATGAKEMLGYKVEFYYKQEEGEDDKTLLYIKKEENNTKVIDSENIEEFKEGVLTYWDGEITRGLNIARSADLIFNGRTFLNYGVDVFKPDEGVITLLDSNADNIYDVVFVNSYEDYVVNNVSLKDEIIYDKYSLPNLNVDEDDEKITIIKDGQKMDLKDIKEWDILTVAKSVDEEVVYITVYNQTVQGTVSEVGDDKANIDGTEYEIAASYKKACSTSGSEAENLDIGDTGTFYLDERGKIAAFQKDETGQQSAVLLRVGLSDGVGKRCEFRLLGADGKWINYKGAEKIEFNGIKKSSEEVYNNFNGMSNYIQIILYETNADNEIKLINCSDARNEGNNLKRLYSNASELSNMVNSMHYRKMGNTFIFFPFFVKKDTKIFALPADPTDPNNTSLIEDESTYEAKTINSFTHDLDYSVALYSNTKEGSDTNIADIVLFITKVITVKNATDVAIVDKIVNVIDEKTGDKAQKLYFMKNGVAGSEIAPNDHILNGLKRGDAIQFATNAKGITYYRKMFSSRLGQLGKDQPYGVDLNSKDPIAIQQQKQLANYWYYDNIDDMNNDKLFINKSNIGTIGFYRYLLDAAGDDNTERENGAYYGTVDIKNGDYIHIIHNNVSGGIPLVNSFCLSDAYIYEYDHITDKVTKVTKGDVAKGQMVFIHTRRSQAKNVVIVK